MRSNEKDSIEKGLTNQPKSKLLTSLLGRLWQLLRLQWHVMSCFMVYKPESNPRSNGQSDKSTQRYAQKARFYAYLPLLEEQRDWLEKIYH